MVVLDCDFVRSWSYLGILSLFQENPTNLNLNDLMRSNLNSYFHCMESSARQEREHSVLWHRKLNLLQLTLNSADCDCYYWTLVCVFLHGRFEIFEATWVLCLGQTTTAACCWDFPTCVEMLEKQKQKSYRNANIKFFKHLLYVQYSLSQFVIHFYSEQFYSIQIFT